MKLNQQLYVFFCLFLSLFSLVAALTFGAADISFVDVIEHLYPHITGESQLASSVFIDKILWELRLPRTLMAFITGVGLAMSGLILQTVTRNPLADPYLFGVSSGASLGVVILIAILGITRGVFISLAAFIGSLVSILCLLLVAGTKRVGQVESMLLAGVALTFLFSSFTSLTLYLTDPQAVTAILFWMLGSFSNTNWSNILLPAISTIVSVAVMLVYRRQLNAMLLGDESATTLGIDVNRFRLIMLILSSLLTASIVAVGGGISFVGLMVPHIVRFFVQQGTSAHLLLTALVGGIFMIWVDVLSRTLLTNQELPIGVITAAIGSVFFLSLLHFRKHLSN